MGEMPGALSLEWAISSHSEASNSALSRRAQDSDPPGLARLARLAQEGSPSQLDLITLVLDYHLLWS